MEDFNWATEIEEVEYYVIDSDAYNRNVTSHTDELSNDEWVLIQIVDRDDENVYYSSIHYNLRSESYFSRPNKNAYVTLQWFEELVSTGYWRRHYTKPTPTLFNHKNNEILKRYEKV
tara:strand:+ start:490 stop:840 length:351 start_codon:yes stop_codon:yes gene_type:complete